MISENRPEWFIADLAIMLSEGITVPAYTTYVEKDYNYIIDDCTPSISFVSNTEQFDKLMTLARKGVDELIVMQRQILGVKN